MTGNTGSLKNNLDYKGKNMAITYETDFAQWAFDQANLLRTGKLQNLDVTNLIEEIEAMGRSEHRELRNRFVILIGHLLKWQFQPERQGTSWRRTIAEQRRQIPLVLSDSPSLKTKLNDEYLQDIWESGVEFASSETDLDNFPETPIWTFAEILDQSFFPE